MPALMSPASSDTFKDNCLAFYPDDQGTDLVHLDDSLTSLHWLQNFCISNHVPGGNCSNFDDLNISHLGYPQGGPCSPSSPTAGDTAATGEPLNHGSNITSSSDSTDRIYGLNYGETEYLPSLSVEVDYKTNPKVKPPYSYVSLICMAMQASEQPKVTVSAIYNWIMDNFCYYRHAEPGWRNSIRHNLSFNCCFKKLPRQKDIEPGKGGFWQIDPQYANMLLTVRRRRMSGNYCKWLAEGSELQRHNTVDYHMSQNECPYQGNVGTSTKGEHLSTKSSYSENHSNIVQMMSKSPLLATEAHGTDIPWGDLDQESFGDALRGNCTKFEDLRHLGYPQGGSHSPSSLPARDIAATSMPLHLGSHIISGSSSTDLQTLRGYGQTGQTGYPHVPLHPCPLVEGPQQLVSLGSDSASVIHGPATVVELGLQGIRCGNSGGDLQNHHQHCYMDLSGVAVECHIKMGGLQMPQQQQSHQDHLQQQHHQPLRHFEEASTLFLEQPKEAQVHPWGGDEEGAGCPADVRSGLCPVRGLNLRDAAMETIGGLPVTCPQFI